MKAKKLKTEDQDGRYLTCRVCKERFTGSTAWRDLAKHFNKKHKKLDYDSETLRDVIGLD